MDIERELHFQDYWWLVIFHRSLHACSTGSYCPSGECMWDIRVRAKLLGLMFKIYMPDLRMPDLTAEIRVYARCKISSSSWLLQVQHLKGIGKSYDVSLGQH